MADTVRSTDQPRRGGAIGLSFSGGGFRATAFSLGTMTLLQDLGLLARARVMSSVSGGSLALATYLCAKAGSDVTKEADFRFDDHFYRRLMTFLEGETLAAAILDLRPLLFRGEKLILRAADATDSFLRHLLQGEDQRRLEEVVLGHEKITDMLANDQLSPDVVFFNATNMTSLDLFRFGIQRGVREAGQPHEPKPVFVLNRYLLKHTYDSAVGKHLYHHAQRLRLADCVAASFAFPLVFEPILFPDDFFRSGQQLGPEACRHFRDDLICDHQSYLALLDGGLYDNLGLASVEDVRQSLEKIREDDRSDEPALHFVIATDVDQIPIQLSAYSDSETDRLLQKKAPQAEGGKWASGLRLPWKTLRRSLLGPGLFRFVRNWSASLALGLLLGLGLGLGFGWGGVLSLALVLVVLGFGVPLVCWFVLLSKLPPDKRNPRVALGVSDAFPAHLGLLESWGQVLGAVSETLVTRGGLLWNLLGIRRLGQLMPAFSGYLKRTRSLTYGYLQQAYAGQNGHQDCHLIRNMIFELSPGKGIDPDCASNMITLPISDYRYEEKQDPLSPIVYKFHRADAVCALLRNLRDQRERQGQSTEALRLSVSELDLGDTGRWSRFDLAATTSPSAGLESGWVEPSLMLSLLNTPTGQLLPEVQRILEELNLDQADHHWRWLCDNLACFEDSNSTGLRPAEPHHLSIPLAASVARLREILTTQVGKDERLLKHCHVKSAENSLSYSWIPLICEMAANVPTNLWLKGLRWYTPGDNGSQQRVNRNGSWSIHPPADVYDEMPSIDLGELGPSPAAVVCAVAGYVSMGFNLLEFFYAWVGNLSEAQKNLYESLCQDPFLFATAERLRQLEDLPYSLRHQVWQRLRREASQGSVPPALLSHLALLEGPLNRRMGLPEMFWTGDEGE